MKYKLAKSGNLRKSGMSLGGYQGRDPVSHRPYSRKVSLKRFNKTGKFAFRRAGEGHRAGEAWGKSKGIDPESRVWRYSKNSPSFDEGVHQYKEFAMEKALNKAKKK